MAQKFYTRYINFDLVPVWGISICEESAQPIYDSWTLFQYMYTVCS